MKKTKTVLFIIILMCVNLSSCGYTSRSLIKERFNSIYIKEIKNAIEITEESDFSARYKVNWPKIENDIKRELIARFITDGTLKVSEEQTADVILEAEVIEFRRDPLRYSTNDEVEEYRLNIAVNLVLWDAKTQTQLWQEKHFTGDTTYFTRGPLAKTEDSAVNEAIKDLCRRIVERVVEQW
ncbi:MAG: LPS assembly lipoprotein LptE [Candidatus Omnitrophica bacterium]|nr:LPS assembly lipoprotein LptE [Candidatus Omnitrophota bacterium]